MRQLKSVLAISALLLVFFSSCKKEIGEEAGVQPSLQNELPTAKARGMTPAQRAKVKELRASLPAGVNERIKTETLKFLGLHPEYQRLVRQALKATAPPCDPNTPLFSWLNDQFLRLSRVKYSSYAHHPGTILQHCSMQANQCDIGTLNIPESLQIFEGFCYPVGECSIDAKVLIRGAVFKK